MTNTNVLVDFRIMGDNYEIQEISELLEIRPTKYWYAGDEIRQTGKKHSYTGWIFSTGYEETFDINTQLNKIEKLFLEKTGLLIDLKNKYSLEYCIEVVINIENKEVPAIYLDLNIINFAAAISAKFDFDTYIN